MSTRKILFVLPAFGILASGALVSGCGGSNPVPSGMSAIPEALNAATPLLNSVGSAVPGLSTAQSVLTTGSIFGLAKQKMPADQFAEVSTAVPGADALASEATKSGLPNNLGGMKDVTKFLGRAKVTPDQVGKTITAIGDQMAGKVSPSTANSFFNALR